jgi:hypothetical protein
MNYLNLETRLLHAPEFIGSDPKARATWLNVSIFAAILENGGRIIGAKSWGNRQWQQSCGVTEREVLHASKLLTWDGDDLLIWAYPLDQESEVLRRREVAKANGIKGGRPPSKPTLKPTSVTGGKPTSEPTSESVKERKGKEGKGSNTLSTPPAPRPRDLVFDAVIEVTGQNPAMSGGEIGKALKAIRTVTPEVTPDEIRRRAANYKSQFIDATLSASALAKWWTKCDDEKNSQMPLMR